LPFLADAQVRSFILERPKGNVSVYNSSGLGEAADEIRALGAATRLVINHGHEVMYGPPRLDVPVFVHKSDRAETRQRLSGLGHLHPPPADRRRPRSHPHTRHDLLPLGQRHAPLPVHRRLTLGRDGEWKAVVLGSSDRAASLHSLRLISDLDFDALVPWAAMKGEPSVNVVNHDDARTRIDAVIARVEAGGGY